VHRPIRDRQAQLLQPVLQLLLGRDGLGLACRLGLQRLCFSLSCFDLVEVAMQSRQLRETLDSVFSLCSSDGLFCSLGLLADRLVEALPLLRSALDGVGGLLRLYLYCWFVLRLTLHHMF
jgi:hypothetical protein